MRRFAKRPGPVLVASIRDLRRMERRPIVFAEHGAGQRYVGVTKDGQRAGQPHPSYSGGPGRGAVTLFLSPNEDVARANAETYPNADVAVVGCPRLDSLVKIPMPTDGVVCISFHAEFGAFPETRNAFQHYRTILKELPKAFGGIIGHAHPRQFDQLERFFLKAGIKPVRSFEEVCRRASLYVSDNSSTLYEFAALGRPVVVMNAPWYRRGVEFGLRFWEKADVGLQANEPQGLIAAIRETLERDPQAQRRAEIVGEVYGALDSKASQRAAEAIKEHLWRTSSMTN